MVSTLISLPRHQTLLARTLQEGIIMTMEDSQHPKSCTHGLDSKSMLRMRILFAYWDQTNGPKFFKSYKSKNLKFTGLLDNKNKYYY